MPAPIEASIKRKVIQQWLSRDRRSKIAIDSNIGEGTVSGIVDLTKIVQKYALDQACSHQSQSLVNLAKLKSYGISEEQIILLGAILIGNQSSL